MEVDVKIKQLHPAAKIPQYAHDTDAGADLYSIEDVILLRDTTQIVRTGLAVEIPPGYEWQIRPRSGLSYKKRIIIANSPGTIDSAYRGEVGIILFNTTSGTIKLKRGERIAQAVLKEVPKANFIVVDELSDTDRGEGGFGSTGMKEIKQKQIDDNTKTVELSPDDRTKLSADDIDRELKEAAESSIEDLQGVAVIDEEGDVKGTLPNDTSEVTDDHRIIDQIKEIDEEVKSEDETVVEKIDTEVYAEYRPMISKALDAIKNRGEKESALVELAIEAESEEDIAVKAILQIVEDRLQKKEKVIIVDILIDILKNIVND